MIFPWEKNSSTVTATIGAGFAFMIATSSVAVAAKQVSIEVPIIHESVRSSSALSRCPHLPGERQGWEEARAAKIRALRGKYKNALTPSEEFASEKRLELEME